MTTTQYVRVFARFWWLLVLCAAVGFLAPAIQTGASSDLYESSSTVQVTGTARTDTGAADAYQSTILAKQRTATYADVARGPELAEAIIASLDLQTSVTALEEQLDVVVPTDSSLLRIDVENSDPDLARRIASSAGDSMVDIIEELETLPGRDFLLLRGRVVIEATTPTATPGPPAWRNPLLGAAAGLLLGLGLAVAVSHVDPRLHDEDGVREALGAPVLGVLPVVRRLQWPPSRPTPGRWRAAVRELRTSIFFRHPGQDQCLTLTLTSPRPDTRVRKIATATAIALVDAGAKVLLIDADLRDAHPVPLLDEAAQDSPGLAGQLTGAMGVEGVIWHDPETGCYVLPAGDPLPNPADLLHSDALAALLVDATHRFDFVLVAAPALSVGTDAVAVAARCDGTILTVAGDQTTHDQVISARRQLDRVDAHVIGAVLLA